MRTGRPTHLTVTLTEAERQTLLRWQRATAMRAALVRRGRILLLVADGGMSLSQVAHAVGISRRFVYLWVRRFQAHGVEGLHDRPRRAAVRRWRGEEEA